MEWSKYQTEIFREVRESSRDLVVQARAGTGKTTTALGMIDCIDPSQSVIFVAFNKSIQLELERRAPAHIEVRTLHSVGFGSLRYAVRSVKVDQNKTRDLARETCPAHLRELNRWGRREAPRELVAGVCRLVGLCKNLMNSPNEILRTAAEFLIDLDCEDEDIIRWTTDLLAACRQQVNVVDFDDMIWLPSQIGAMPRAFDVVIVDEAQDVNPAQLWLIRQMLRRGGRLIAVGDDRQAIYRFRGAGGGVLGHLASEFDAIELPLPLTYRCPKAVVRLAQEVVPDYEAHESNPEGLIQSRSMDQAIAAAQPGEAILSRTNAPLVGACLALLRRGVPAFVAGRDIGGQLCGLIRKSKATEIEPLLDWLVEWEEAEVRRLHRMDAPEASYDLVHDRARSIEVLAEGETDVESLICKIERMFEEVNGNTGRAVICSTVHKAKGLEWPSTYLIADTFRKGRNTDEDNIWYVAVTRTSHNLTWITE